MMASIPAADNGWKLPPRGRVGMYCLIAAESAIFVILIVAYLFYLGKSLSGPTPAILRVPVLFTVCLLSSSLTIHAAVKSLSRGNDRPGSDLPRRYRFRVATPDPRRRADDSDQFVWHHLLHARRPACIPRDGRAPGPR